MTTTVVEVPERELEVSVREAVRAGIPLPVTPLEPVLPPFFAPVSGLYQAPGRLFPPLPYPRIPQPIPIPIPNPDPGPITPGLSNGAESALFPFWFPGEELRLDVDRRYPQSVASGTIRFGLKGSVHWIANLTATAAGWTGDIWYKDGDASLLPQTAVEIKATKSWFPEQRKAIATFKGGGAPNRTVAFSFKSNYFHPVEFEFDCAQGTTAVTQINTGDHPNRPATLPAEALTIETVFQRAGFDVKKLIGSIVPLAGAGPGAMWSDAEMHDAMQIHWSRFANNPQWSMWTFFASLHEQGTSLGGIMFDDIGPNHRQGTAIFNEAFIKNAPAGDANPAAWVARMRFWTGVHEMGHSFNLAHSWQKSHPPTWGTPWIPLTNEPEARSFMNYPYNVAGGQSAFFSNFEFRFSDNELLFMRHAPGRFVQMGNADWFDHHGFEQAEISAEPQYRLELRVNRAKSAFEFLEPVVLELKLTNITSQVQIINRDLLRGTEDMTVILKKQGKAARQWSPFAHYCYQAVAAALNPGDSIYDSLFVAAGKNGWDIAEPGVYTVQIALHLDDQDIVSNPLRLQVAPPRGYEEENFAQDFLSQDVGRVLAFDGSQVLNSAQDTLRLAADKFKDRRVSCHALVALGMPQMRDYKVLDQSEEAMRKDPRGVIRESSAKVEEARKKLQAALESKPDLAAETLGHIDYRFYVDNFSAFLAEKGDRDAAAKCQDELHSALEARNVLPIVLEQIARRRDNLKESKGTTRSGKTFGRGTGPKRR